LLVTGLLLALLTGGCSSDGGTRSPGQTAGGSGGSGGASGPGSAAATSPGGGAQSVAAQHPSATCKAGGAGSGGVVVDLDEWSVAPRPPEVRHGRVLVRARNRGKVAHNLAIARVPSPSALPTTESQIVAEEQLPKGDFIGQIESVPPGRTCTANFTLTAGTYALYCDVIDQTPAGPRNHFAKGMVTVFSVR